MRAAKPDIPDFPPEIKRQAEIEVKYQGYIDRQQAEVKKFRRMEDTPLPEGTDYHGYGRPAHRGARKAAAPPAALAGAGVAAFRAFPRAT